ncbi:MAG: DUF1643 domain-containing protein [Bacteroidetes bacterium]|nr:DUF1643 domain-containing protein [Bacteroidota bacterium]
MKKNWLKYNYEFSGLFYKAGKINCRMVLDIREIDSKLEDPDLIVIMMNPGGSKPEDQSYKFNTLQKATFVPTQPDLTQWKVIDFMKSYGYKYARILNLSDLCETKSGKLKSKEFRDYSNFFTPSGEKDLFDTFFTKETDLLIAWGSMDIAKKTITNALEKIRTKNCPRIYGFQHTQERNFFYHPLKRPQKGTKYDINLWLNGVKILEENTLKQLLSIHNSK